MGASEADDCSIQADSGPSSKKQKSDAADNDLRRFYRSWAWKREHRPDKDRFHRPYKHPITLPGSHSPTTLSIKQQKFGPEGFASTVWDSSIVMAKYIEKWPSQFAGKRCLDLSAGCGLVAVVMAKFGGSVTATDLSGNLPLLTQNCQGNGVPEVHVCEHRWGCTDVHQLQPPFDIITACDVMYIDELVPELIKSLILLSGPHTSVYIAHGRNRPAEPAFKQAAAHLFRIEMLRSDELDEVYQCSDVDVLRLSRSAQGQDLQLEQEGGQQKQQQLQQ